MSIYVTLNHFLQIPRHHVTEKGEDGGAGHLDSLFLPGHASLLRVEQIRSQSAPLHMWTGLEWAPR